MQEVLARVRATPFTPTTNTTTAVSTNRYYVTPEIETGNDLIDSEHRQIFDAVNELLDACSNGQGRQKIEETAEFLSGYVGNHFSDEERLQKKYDYPHMESHFKFHRKYESDVKRFVEKMKHEGANVQTLGQLNALASKLINHIRHEDKRLAAYIRKRLK